MGKKTRRDGKGGKPARPTWKRALSAPVNPHGLEGQALKDWKQFVREQEALLGELLPPPPDKCEPILAQSAYEDVLFAYPLVAEPKEEELPWSHTPAGNLLAKRAAQELARRVHERVETWDGPPTTVDQVNARFEQLSTWIKSVMEAIGYDENGKSGGGILGLFAVKTPSAEWLESFNPPPPAEVLPMLSWPSAFIGPADFLGSIPSSVSDAEKAERILRNLQAAKDWLGFVELPQNIDVRGWLEVEAKLTNLWMSMRVFALGIQSWIEGSCAIFEDSMVPRLTVYSEDKRHVEVANAGFVEVVQLTPKLGEEFWDLCAGKSIKMLYRRKRTLAEKVPSVARFIISDPAVAIEDQVNWTGVRLHPTLTARIKRKKRIPV